MKDIYVGHFSYVLGDQELTVEETVKQGRTIIKDTQSFRNAGFAKHHICSPQTSAYDLALAAVQPIASHLDGVGAIIYTTALPINANVGMGFENTKDVKDLMDFPVSHLQSDLGLDNAWAIGLDQQACTGMIGSLKLAAALLRDTPEWQKILCITADRFPEGSLYEQSYSLISDGASACIVSTQPIPEGFRYIEHHAITNGGMAQTTNDQTVGIFFPLTVDCIRTNVSRAGLELKDIQWLVTQNINVNAWKVVCSPELLDYDLTKVYYPSLSITGHVISGDCIINTRFLIESGKVQPDDYVLLYMVGYGLNWQSVILQYCK